MLGVAFNNIRVDGLYPVISVSSNARVVVNFGKNFRYPFRGTFGLNPSLTEREKKTLEKLFRIYHDAGIDEEGDPGELIKGRGVLQLSTDIGAEGPLDPHIPIFAWKLSSRVQWEFHKDEFMTTLALEGACNSDDMIKTFKKWYSDIKDEEEIFRSWYSFVYDYLKAKQATVLAVEEAVSAWKILGINNRWNIFPKWEDYILNSGKVKGVNADTWMMLLSLIDKVGSDPNKFDDSDCWPSVIEDFVLDVWKS